MKAQSLTHLAGLAPIAIAGLLITACGSATASGGAGGSQHASGGSGSSGSGGSVDDGIGHPVNVCSLLPITTVASVSAEPITLAQEQDTVSYRLYTCNYTSADGTSGLTVSVLALDAAAGYAAAVQAAGSGGRPISGLGDKAFSSILGLQALFGNVSITVSNLQSDDASETLIRDLQPKL